MAAKSAARKTRNFEDFVTGYTSLLKQAESNQIALGREAHAARDYCRKKKVSFVKFCEAVNMPRRSVYNHIRTYEAYTWLRDEKGVSKTAISNLPAGSIIQLQELLAHDPDGAEELVTQLTDADKRREQLKLAKAADHDVDKAAEEELKKQEQAIREELERKYREKIKRARQGAKDEITLLENKLEGANKKAQVAIDRAQELAGDLQEAEQKVAAAQASQGTDSGDSDKLKAVKREARELRKSLENWRKSYDELNEELNKLKEKRSAKVKTEAKALAKKQLQEVLALYLYDLREMIRESLATFKRLDGGRKLVAGCNWCHEVLGEAKKLVKFLEDKSK